MRMTLLLMSFGSRLIKRRIPAAKGNNIVRAKREIVSTELPFGATKGPARCAHCEAKATGIRQTVCQKLAICMNTDTYGSFLDFKPTAIFAARHV